MKNSISILTVSIALSIVPSISCSAVSKTKPSPVLKPSAKPKSPTVPVIAKPKAKPGTVLWEWTSKDGRSVSTPSLGFDGHLYVYTHNSQLVVIDRSSGKTVRHRDIPNVQSFHGGPDGTIAIGNNGSLYLPHSKAMERFTPHDLNATWSYTGKRMHPYPCAALGHDGLIYFAGGGNKMIYAVDQKLGTLKWSYLTKNLTGVAPVVDGKNNVFVGSTDGVLYAFNGQTGEIQWRYADKNVFSFGQNNLHYEYTVDTPAIGNNGLIYAPCKLVKGEGLLAISADKGELKWKYQSKDGYVCSPIIGKRGELYFGTTGGALVSLNPETGEEIWKTERVFGSLRTQPALGDDGTIYFGSRGDRNIYAVDSKSGEIKWKVKTGDFVVTAPLIDNAGNLYVGSHDGRLYAIATSSTGPAKSPWPMYGQNAQRTHRAPATK